MINTRHTLCNPSTTDEVPPSYEEATGIPMTKLSRENTSIPIPAEPDTTSQNTNMYRMYSEFAKYDSRTIVYTMCMMIMLLLITALAAIRISRGVPVQETREPYFVYNPN